jgi:hypothetical protein
VICGVVSGLLKLEDSFISRVWMLRNQMSEWWRRGLTGLYVFFPFPLFVKLDFGNFLQTPSLYIYTCKHPA